MKWLSLLILVSTSMLLPSLSLSQADMRHGIVDSIGEPKFHLDAITLLSSEPARTRVIVYSEISFSNLQFVRSGDGFEASYEIDLSILAGKDDSAPRVANRIWRSEVETRDYDATNSSEMFHISEASFDLRPGTYTMLATLTDLETRHVTKVNKPLVVPGYRQGELQLGDIIIAKKVSIDSAGNFLITPNVDRTVFDAHRPVYIYFEIYPGNSDQLSLYWRVLNGKGDIVREQRQSRSAERPILRDFFTIDVKEFGVGNFSIEFQVASDDRKVLKRGNFRVHILGLPGTIDDIDTAIRQMRYIAKTKLVKEMRRADPVRKEQLFKEYWKSKDPTPDTPVNELMHEYYTRTEYANRMFGSFRDGWETDRGEVYIRFGAPSEVERHPYDIDTKPYEIWYYYEIQRRFVFVDDFGYGDYRLVTNLWR